MNVGIWAAGAALVLLLGACTKRGRIFLRGVWDYSFGLVCFIVLFVVILFLWLWAVTTKEGRRFWEDFWEEVCRITEL